MRRRILLAGCVALVMLAVLIALVVAFFSSSTVPEKLPIEPGSPAAAYVVELEESRTRFWSWSSGGPQYTSPDGKARLDIESHRTLIPGGRSGRHTIWLERAGERRELFSLWEADPGSGLSFDLSWSSDSKAILLIGSTSGWGRFSGAYERLSVVYLVDSEELWYLQPFEGSLPEAMTAAADADPVIAFPAIEFLGSSESEDAVRTLLELWDTPQPTRRHLVGQHLLYAGGRQRGDNDDLAASAAGAILFSDAPAALRRQALRAWLWVKGRDGLPAVVAWLEGETDEEFLNELRRQIAKKPWPEAREVERRLAELEARREADDGS